VHSTNGLMGQSGRLRTGKGSAEGAAIIAAATARQCPSVAGTDEAKE
jgi:hypothetical protein